MTRHIAGSVTRDAAALHSPDSLVREQAARRIWERFEPELVGLVRRRLNPKIRLRADEEDIVQSMFRSVCAVGRQGNRPPPADRDALWRCLVWMTMCKVANTVHLHQALRPDVRREEPRRGPPLLLAERFATWMAELEDRDALVPADAAVVREEFDRLLGLLPEELQQIFVWKLEGHTNAEIGRRIDRTERTVELKLRIIRKTLERDLGTHARFEPLRGAFI
jgi:DNA-directed RNA polymerase specialized sigma24 family protein